MYLVYYNFNFEDWQNIVLTCPFMFKEYRFIYPIWENTKMAGLPAIIEIYQED